MRRVRGMVAAQDNSTSRRSMCSRSSAVSTSVSSSIQLMSAGRARSPFAPSATAGVQLNICIVVDGADDPGLIVLLGCSNGLQGRICSEVRRIMNIHDVRGIRILNMHIFSSLDRSTTISHWVSPLRLTLGLLRARVIVTVRVTLIVVTYVRLDKL